MKRCALVILTFLFISYNSFSQITEVGAFFGTSYYLGDLNPSKQFAMAQPASGFLLRYTLNPRWVIKSNLYWFGTLKGDDAITNTDRAEDRNLRFQSAIGETSVLMELNFLPYWTGSAKHFFTPYIFSGIALFVFKPKAEYNGELYDLKSLGTEGQGYFEDRKPYSLTQFSIPFGMGLKFSLSNVFCLSAEWGLRKTFTDYIDDVSKTYVGSALLDAHHPPIASVLADRSIVKHEPGMQRGDSHTKDWYSFAGIMLTVKVSGLKKKTCPGAYHTSTND